MTSPLNKNEMTCEDAIIARIDSEIAQIYEDLPFGTVTFDEPEWIFEDKITLHYARSGYSVSIKDHELVIRWD